MRVRKRAGVESKSAALIRAGIERPGRGVTDRLLDDSQLIGNTFNICHPGHNGTNSSCEEEPCWVFFLMFVSSVLLLIRSQLAMKFLDPAFTSLNNALNENLQESNNWRFNKTAYVDQRWTSQTHLTKKNQLEFSFTFSLVLNSSLFFLPHCHIFCLFLS